MGSLLGGVVEGKRRCDIKVEDKVDNQLKVLVFLSSDSGHRVQNMISHIHHCSVRSIGHMVCKDHKGRLHLDKDKGLYNQEVEL